MLMVKVNFAVRIFLLGLAVTACFAEPDLDLSLAAELDSATNMNATMNATMNDAALGVDSQIITIGSHGGGYSDNTKDFTVPEGYSCPPELSKANWPQGDTHPDRFQITHNGGTSWSATRLDANHGWGMNLKITCNPADGNPAGDHPPISQIITIGSHGGGYSDNTKSFTVPVGYSCPPELSRDNWPQSDTHPDRFQITHNGGTLWSATRLDAHHGWGMNLLITCGYPLISSNNADANLRKPTTQSSEGASGHSSRAVDSNKATDYGSGHCTHTGDPPKLGEWWQVDLGGYFKVTQVKIWNRSDCCASRLNNFKVMVDAKVCEAIGSAFGTSPRTLTCSDTDGQYVRIAKMNTEVLTLCEVEVYGYSIPAGKLIFPVTSNYHCGGDNVSPLKDGTVYGWAPGVGGVDACKEKCRADPDCTAFVWRTSDKKCFWKKNTSPATPTTLAGHDCYMKTSETVTSENEGDVAAVPAAYSKKYSAKWPHCSNVNNVCISGTRAYMEAECDRVSECTGFSFPVGATSGDGCLKKCGTSEFGGYGSGSHDYWLKYKHSVSWKEEIRGDAYVPLVQGAVGTLVSRDRPTVQSSESSGGKSDRAVDGISNGSYGSNSCTHTKEELGAWWTVDLGAVYAVSQVKIWNRSDCCTEKMDNIMVIVDDVTCEVIGKFGASPRTVQCNGAEGEVLRIEHQRMSVLTLCEVEVYGTEVLKEDGEDVYSNDFDKHCGGTSIDPLEDGTPSGWEPGTAGQGACEDKCSASASCTAFVWRVSDQKCFWKKTTSASTMHTMVGHNCLTRTDVTQVAGVPTAVKAPREILKAASTYSPTGAPANKPAPAPPPPAPPAPATNPHKSGCCLFPKNDWGRDITAGIFSGLESGGAQGLSFTHKVGDCERDLDEEIHWTEKLDTRTAPPTCAYQFTIATPTMVFKCGSGETIKATSEMCGALPISDGSEDWNAIGFEGSPSMVVTLFGMEFDLLQGIKDWDDSDPDDKDVIRTRKQKIGKMANDIPDPGADGAGICFAFQSGLITGGCKLGFAIAQNGFLKVECGLNPASVLSCPAPPGAPKIVFELINFGFSPDRDLEQEHFIAFWNGDDDVKTALAKDPFTSKGVLTMMGSMSFTAFEFGEIAVEVTLTVAATLDIRLPSMDEIKAVFAKVAGGKFDDIFAGRGLPGFQFTLSGEMSVTCDIPGFFEISFSPGTAGITFGFNMQADYPGFTNGLYMAAMYQVTLLDMVPPLSNPFFVCNGQNIFEGISASYATGLYLSPSAGMGYAIMFDLDLFLFRLNVGFLLTDKRLSLTGGFYVGIEDWNLQFEVELGFDWSPYIKVTDNPSMADVIAAVGQACKELWDAFLDMIKGWFGVAYEEFVQWKQHRQAAMKTGKALPTWKDPSTGKLWEDRSQQAAEKHKAVSVEKDVAVSMESKSTTADLLSDAVESSSKSKAKAGSRAEWGHVHIPHRHHIHVPHRHHIHVPHNHHFHVPHRHHIHIPHAHVPHRHHIHVPHNHHIHIPHVHLQDIVNAVVDAAETVGNVIVETAKTVADAVVDAWNAAKPGLIFEVYHNEFVLTICEFKFHLSFKAGATLFGAEWTTTFTIYVKITLGDVIKWIKDAVTDGFNAVKDTILGAVGRHLREEYLQEEEMQMQQKQQQPKPQQQQPMGHV